LFEFKHTKTRKPGATFTISIPTNVQYIIPGLLERIKDDIHKNELQETLKLLLSLPSYYATITLETLPRLLIDIPTKTVVVFDVKRGAHYNFLKTLSTHLWPLVESVVYVTRITSRRDRK